MEILTIAVTAICMIAYLRKRLLSLIIQSQQDYKSGGSVLFEK